jgi:cob(I)alamin adenosyltransferase
MKLYTRTGDDGTTGLFGGERVAKDHPRISACGDIDELNAALGLVASELQRMSDEESGKPRLTSRTTPPEQSQAWSARKTRGGPDSDSFLDLAQHVLTHLQSRLFDIGADLATPAGSKHATKVMRITNEHVAEAERSIDQIDAGNAPMKHFVLPGGTELASRLHLARTICRRAERSLVQLQRAEPITPAAMIYINRVSDLLFAMARRANSDAGVPDVPWVPESAEKQQS